jgi:glycosyltransferase involved in cell wall biosynthesis
MTIVQLTPGTGGMYCGNCFRDNALVAELRRLGHEAWMVPLYLPLTLDEPDQSAGTPIFLGGINVYLEQKFPWFGAAPRWLRSWLSSPGLLAKAAGYAAKTRAEEVGALLLSMLHGEAGSQAREIDDLVAWLTARVRPEVVCLSNALLVGLAQPLRRQLGARLVCFLQGEDIFLDSLAAPYRDPAWQLLQQKARDVDLFIAPNRYFAGVMTDRLRLRPGTVRVIPEGIALAGYRTTPGQQAQDGGCGEDWTAFEEIRSASSALSNHESRCPAWRSTTVGYLARLCPEKGLHVLIEAFIELHRRGRVPAVRLKVGGGCGPSEVPYVKALESQLAHQGLAESVSFHPNLSREQKIAFLQSLDLFSVPATQPEASGMYLVEALAAGVPVVQPRFASFPEFVETTGGGVLYDPERRHGLVDALEQLLLDPARRRELSATGQRAVHEQFNAPRMAREVAAAMACLS